ncbi:antA/AntB antirepressor family protein [Citrobacter freundii]|nr:antA/AntB antirepressor family protein [Citrobacter freundii]MEB1088920.1 antA/AntB antirepressor family protein [Citrobacter freundii]
MTIEKSRFNSEAAPQSNTCQGEHSNNDFAAIVPVISGQIGGREASIVSAKALHKALGVGNDFSTWIKLRIDEYGFNLSADYVVFDSSDFRNQSSNFEQCSPGWVTKRGGDRRSKDYGLSLGMAKELAMVERNEQGRAVRRYFIQCEEELQRSVPEIAASYRRQLKARIGAASLFKPMCVALQSARAEQGKQTQARHYTNESNMIARIVLGGMTAKQWALANGVTGEPRDSMNAGQLDHHAYLESTNITLIDMGMEYDQRKGELTRLSQRWLAKRLEATHD